MESCTKLSGSLSFTVHISTINTTASTVYNLCLATIIVYLQASDLYFRFDVDNKRRKRMLLESYSFPNLTV